MPELKDGKPKRRIMREFRITEISSVTLPAQEGAVMTLMKRREDPVPFEKITRPDEPKTFTEAVAIIKAREKCSGTTAMRKAYDEHPDLYAKLQATPVPVEKDASQPDPVIAFNKRVTDVAQRFGIPRTEAMQRVADEDPELLKAYRAA